jgi:O-antigen/teichoic acid export membrane protein
MLHKKLLKGGAVLTGGNVVSAVASFARNLIVANFVSVGDFGIASTFAITLSLIEMTSNLAVDRIVVQATDGDSPEMIGTAHAFQVLRGAIGAVAMFALAYPIATIFQIPDLTWAFRVLALVPLIRGFSHLDLARCQRKMNFLPSMLSNTVSQLTTLAISVPLLLYIPDFRSMLVLIVVQISVAMIVSHVMAERKYEWAWNKRIVRRIIKFGSPLLLDGFIIFGIYQGDKAIIGYFYDVESLGFYSVALMIAMTPGMFLDNIIRTTVFPILSASNGDAEQFQERSNYVIQLHLLAGTLYAALLVLTGPFILKTFFEERYMVSTTLLPWLSVLQAIRIMKSAANSIAIAKEKTTNPLYGNLFRLVFLGVACCIASLGGPLENIAIAATVGELSATVASFILLRATIGTKFTKSKNAFFASAMLITLAISLNLWHPFSKNIILQLALAISLWCVTSLTMVATCPELKTYAGKMCSQLSEKIKLRKILRRS